MYLREITIENVRTIKKATLALNYPGRRDQTPSSRPKLRNVNLLLGNNGSGKSSLLRSIAIAALGPVAEKLSIYRMVRYADGSAQDRRALVDAEFELHVQDTDERPSGTHRLRQGGQSARQLMEITRHGEDFEVVRVKEMHSLWERSYDGRSHSFFIVGYGATRRVELLEHSSVGSRSRSHGRVQRVQGLFQDSWGLMPLNAWLPESVARNPGRASQVRALIDRLLPKGYGFVGERERSSGEYLFRCGRTTVPFLAMSDGLKAYIGWIADLLYHVCFTCPPGLKLVDNQGMVLVDEVDLHLHPDWQREVVPKLAKALPNLQFIFTTHSPLVVGSLERWNVWLCETRSVGTAEVLQLGIPVHGLNADQILLTDYFGVSSSRSKRKERQLEEIAREAEMGNPEAAQNFIRELVKPLDA